MSGDELARVFRILDGDPEASDIINTKASQWQKWFHYLDGLEGTSSHHKSSGLLNGAMERGYVEALQDLQKMSLDEAQADYQSNC